jgi:hypothetical protein
MKIPECMMPAIRRYIDDHVQPGNFLTAVIDNDLKEACCRADEENLENLKAFVLYFYNEAPSQCFGSPEKRIAWCALRKEI